MKENALRLIVGGAGDSGRKRGEGAGLYGNGDRGLLCGCDAAAIGNEEIMGGVEHQPEIPEHGSDRGTAVAGKTAIQL